MPSGCACQGMASKPSPKLWYAGIGRWWWWWKGDAPGAGGASKSDTSLSFAPSDLITRRQQQQQQQKDVAATTINKEAEAKGPGQVQPKNNQEGWTEVTKKRRGSPKQGDKSPTSSPPQKQTRAPAAAKTTPEPSAAAAAAAKSPTATVAAAARTTTTTTITEPPAAAAAKTPTKPRATAAAITTTTTTESSAAPATMTPKKPTTPKTSVTTAPSPKKTKKKIKNIEEMETSTNLKRRRDSGEGAAKKMCPEKNQPEAGPSSQPQIPLPSPPVPSPPPTLPPTPFPPPKITLQSSPQQMDSLSPQHELFKKYHHPYKIPLPRSQSAERAQPSGLARTPSLPSLSSADLSSQELFPAIISPKRKTDPPKKTNYHELSIGQIQRAAALCSAELEAVGDFQLRKALKPLLSLEKVKNLNVSNPANFRSAAMVTTFVRSAGDRTKGVWKFLSTVCQTDTGIKLAELEHSSLKKCLTYCSGRVPILVHPSLYRALKLKFPIDVGGITRDNRVTTELGTGSLRQAVGILTPKDFRPVVDNE